MGLATKQAYRWAVPVLLWALLLIPAIVEIIGFRSAHLLSQEIWIPLGLHHLWRYLILFAAVTVPVAVLFRQYLFPGVILLLAIGSVFAIGPVAAGSVLVFVFSATAAGKLVFGRALETRLAFMAGLAFWIVAMTVTARLPIHYPATYWIALAAPVCIGYRETRRLASEWLNLFRPHPISLAETAAFLLLAFVLIAHWLIVLKPEASTDGLATHLAIPFGMARFHVFNFDFRRFIWALMPLGADLCYSVLYILGGEYAARLLNFALLTAIAALLFQEARRVASRAVALLMTALFLSTPLVQLVTGSLFVENFVAAMCLAGVIALWRYRETTSARYLLLMGALLGTAISLKLAAFAIVLLALPFLIGAMPRPRLALAAAAVLIAIGCVPYATAWWRSGNPIFPYANSTFHSPYVGNDVVDVRFHPALSWNTPVRLTINTHDYFEGQDGTFGFQYFLMLPLTLAFLVPSRSVVARSAIVIGVGGAVIVAATQPNARYFYVTLPFLSLGAAAALSWIESTHKSLFLACLVACCMAAVANIYFLPASNWHHRDFYTSPLLRASGRKEYLAAAAPVREVIDYLNRTAPTEAVYYADGTQIAGLLAPAYRYSWHDYAFSYQVDACQTPQDLYLLLAGLGIRHIIVDRYVTERLPPITAIIATCAEGEFTMGNFSAMKLTADCESRLAGSANRK
jgi:hypothetical protein